MTMEHNDTLRKMRDMKLAGMADAFSEQLADRLAYDKLPAEDRIAMLVDAELDRRRTTKLANLVKNAKLRFPDARSESVIYDPKRGLSVESMARYFSCKFVEEAVDLAITGPTGSGKSWLSCAIAMSLCKHFHTTRYTRMPVLLGELSAAKDADRYERVLAKYKKYECLVVDDVCEASHTSSCTKPLRGSFPLAT